MEVNPMRTRTVSELVADATSLNEPTADFIKFSTSLMTHPEIVDVRLRTTDFNRHAQFLIYVKKGGEDDVIKYLNAIDESKPLCGCVVNQVLNNGLVM